MRDHPLPGSMPMDRFVAARLTADDALVRVHHTAACSASDAATRMCHCPVPVRERAELAAHRRLLDAYRDAEQDSTHRASLEVALKALAGVWAEHPDYDPTWRL